MERRSIEKSGLLRQDTVYVLSAASQRIALSEVARDLKKKNLVKDNFVEAVLEREKRYPTGMDMSCVNPELPNFAIPHTEADLVKTTRIVPVRLLVPLTWHTVLDPAKTCELSFYFMTLKDDPSQQTDVLANLMDFVTACPAEEVCRIFAHDNPVDLYKDLFAYF